jgi:phage baseplate assembly protein W
MAIDIYGRGFGFPLRVGADGRMVWSEGELNVRESMCIILRTRPGERIERPSFGCGLDQFLFEPNSVATLRLIQEEVKQALVRWEPRVALQDVRTEVNPTDQRAVDITVSYRLIASGRAERLRLTIAMAG